MENGTRSTCGDGD